MMLPFIIMGVLREKKPVVVFEALEHEDCFFELLGIYRSGPQSGQL